MATLYGVKQVAKLYAQTSGKTPKEAENEVRQMLRVFKVLLLSKECGGLQFVDFFTLKKVWRNQRIGRVVKAGKPITIPARTEIKADTGKGFLRELNQ